MQRPPKALNIHSWNPFTMSVTHIAYRFHKDLIDREIDFHQSGIHAIIDELYNRKNISKVLAFCRRLLHRDPNDLYANQKMGTIYRNNLNNPEIAERFLKTAVENGANHAVIAELAEMYRDTGDNANAKRYYEESLSKGGELKAMKSLAGIYHDEGDLENAEMLYRKIIEYTNTPADMYNLGALLMDAGRFEESITVFQDLKKWLKGKDKRYYSPFEKSLHNDISLGLVRSYMEQGKVLQARIEEIDFQDTSRQNNWQ